MYEMYSVPIARILKKPPIPTTQPGRRNQGPSSSDRYFLDPTAAGGQGALSQHLSAQAKLRG